MLCRGDDQEKVNEKWEKGSFTEEEQVYGGEKGACRSGGTLKVLQRE